MDDGTYTKIPNALMDWLISSGLSKREFVVVLAVIRNTLGWHRQSSVLSCRFIATATGLKPGHVSEAIKGLEERGILLVDRTKMTAVISLAPIDTLVRLCLVEKEVPPAALPESVPETGTVPKTGTEVFPIQEQKCYRNRNRSVPETGTNKVNEINLNKGKKDQMANWLTG